MREVKKSIPWHPLISSVQMALSFSSSFCAEQPLLKSESWNAENSLFGRYIHICMCIYPICPAVNAWADKWAKLTFPLPPPVHSPKLIVSQDAVGHIVNYCLSLLHLRHHTGLENSLQTDGELLEMNLKVCEKKKKGYRLYDTAGSDGLLIFNNILERKEVSTCF